MIIEQLIAALKEFDTDLSALDVADALWLALKIVQPADQQVPKTPEPKPEPKPEPEPKPVEVESFKVRSKTTPQGKYQIYPKPTYSGEQPRKAYGKPIRLPTANALPGAFRIARSLRSLCRRIPSRTSFFFDDQATVERLAEEEILIPEERPVLERWLDVALIYDIGASMAIWQPTVMALFRLLVQLSAFRDIRLWEMVTDDSTGNVQLYKQLSGTGGERTPRSTKELIDPGGRRLILVVSDCVSLAWHTGKMGRVLDQWGNSNPTALLQVLPPHFWHRTALAHETKIRIQAHQPGLPNTQLSISYQETVLFDKQNDHQAGEIAVPVITLEPLSLSSWSRMMTGIGETRVAGYLLNTRREEKPPSQVTPVHELKDEQRLQRYKSMVSPTAFQLAGFLTGAPVSLPVIYLIQQALLPSSWQTHIAEIFLGGILKRTSRNNVHPFNVHQQQYEFIGNTRQQLRNRVPSATIRDVTQLISDYMEKHYADPHTFPALLADPQATEGIAISSAERILAEANAEVLSRMGYDHLAENLTNAKDTSSEQKITYPDKVTETVEIILTATNLRKRVLQLYEQLKHTTQKSPEYLELSQDILALIPVRIIPDPAPLPPMSIAPSRNALSHGHNDYMRALAKQLRNESRSPGTSVALVGIGGIGKTHLSAEFVHRYGQFFAGGVFWISFADPDNIPIEIARCGGEVGLQLRPDFHTLPLDDQVAAVRRAWNEEIPRLLVFDNVDGDDGEALVKHYRPTSGGGRVLITSRRGEWDATLGITTLSLGVLPRDESIALLHQFRADLSEHNAGAIAGELGDLPLALHLAGSFLKKYARTKEGDPATFLTRLRDPALLEHPSLQGRAIGTAWSYHEKSVARAFALSYERLRPDDETDAIALRCWPVPPTLHLVKLSPMRCWWQRWKSKTNCRQQMRWKG